MELKQWIRSLSVMTEVNTILTEDDWAWLNSLQIGEQELAAERPIDRKVGNLTALSVPSLLVDARLSPETTRREERRLAAIEKNRLKKLANRKMKRAKGRVHWKKKEATRKREALRRWMVQPRKCLVYGHGVWNIPEEEWDRCIAPLWSKYNPKHLTVKRKWGKGTKAEPYTVYDLTVLYKDEVVYSGLSQWVFDNSKPNSLDVELAHEGAQLLYARSRSKLA